MPIITFWLNVQDLIGDRKKNDRTLMGNKGQSKHEFYGIRYLTRNKKFKLHDISKKYLAH